MRINHNIASMIGSGAVYQANKHLNSSIEKLSTGLRINRASDDAAGLGVSENLRTQVRGLGMAKRNAQDGIALLNIAEGAMNEVADILQRMRELAVQSSTDTLTDTQRSYTNAEFGQLIEEIDRITAATKYNGQTLLDGTIGGSILHIGPNDSTTADEMTITIEDVTAGTLGVDLEDLTIQANAFGAITVLDDAINTVSGARGTLGANVNRLDHAINNIINQEHNTAAAESLIRDTDFALETANFSKSSILQQSATAMLAQANMAPQSILGLLSR